MKEGPDIVRIAAQIGDPSRANMLMALMSGKALTAGELAREAGIAAATASGHLAQLTEMGLVRLRKQGRHRYFELAGPEVAALLEELVGLAARQGHSRTRTGPSDDGLRQARVCYDHLAGAMAVTMFESMAGRGYFRVSPDAVDLTDAGAGFIRDIGIDLQRSRRRLCRVCVDWSERRSHLGGHLGAQMLDHFLAQDWLRRSRDSRKVTITPPGRLALAKIFPELRDRDWKANNGTNASL
ncbi:MAG: helix-turn-helix domain-containing protein [Pseudomonadota bacterium]